MAVSFSPLANMGAFSLSAVRCVNRGKPGNEVNTVELSKYNLAVSVISASPTIEQWAFFLLHAHSYEAGELRGLLPAIPFQQAIDVIETIAQKSEDRTMYDQREKAQRDYDWAISSARQEGVEQGIEKGVEQGSLAGRIQMLQILLGEAETSTNELTARGASELENLLADLQSRLRQRDK